MKVKLVKFLCALLFCSFSFSYLYFYQSEIMQVTQHIASKGQTTYSPLLGAILITIVLLLLQFGINKILKLSKRGYALTYLPSLLLLSLLTSIKTTTHHHYESSWALWIVGAILILFCIVAYYVKKYEPYEQELRTSFISYQHLWINIRTLVVLFLLVTLTSNADKKFHKQLKIEALLSEKRYQDVLNMMKSEAQLDTLQSIYTLYALKKTNQLSDSLFYYPIVKKGDLLITQPQISPLLIKKTQMRGVFTRTTNNRMIACLIDKDLATFSKYLKKAYTNDSLYPKYYQEADSIYRSLNKGKSPKLPLSKGSYAKHFFD